MLKLKRGNICGKSYKQLGTGVAHVRMGRETCHEERIAAICWREGRGRRAEEEHLPLSECVLQLRFDWAIIWEVGLVNNFFGGIEIYTRTHAAASVLYGPERGRNTGY